jgi:8-oxo-dGTP pyrophosphatase MutT (NUDIX family)
MELKAYISFLLFSKDEKKVLLLKRAANKSFAPNLITGVGGTVEFEQGEAKDMWRCAFRELQEECGIIQSEVTRLGASLQFIRPDPGVTHLITWCTDTWEGEIPVTKDGVLYWYDIDNLPIEEMVPSAQLCIPYVIKAAREQQDPTLALYLNHTLIFG